MRNVNIVDKLHSELKKAMLSHNEVEKRVLRMLIAAVKNKEISTSKPITEEEFDVIVKKQIKERGEAMEDYKRGGRKEAFEEEKKEQEILKKFARPEFSDEELEKLVSEAIEKLGVSSSKEIGKVMGFLMKTLKGKASGDRVREIVEKLL